MAKGHNRNDIEDRCFLYRDARWKRGLSQNAKGETLNNDQASLNKCYVQDVDQLEYAIIDDDIIDVAILEITRVDKNDDFPNPTKRYFDAILNRYKKDFQGRRAIDLGKKLNCNAYIVLFKYDMSKLWVYNLSKEKGFKEFNQEEYFSWLKNLHKYMINKNNK